MSPSSNISTDVDMTGTVTPAGGNDSSNGSNYVNNCKLNQVVQAMDSSIVAKNAEIADSRAEVDRTNAEIDMMQAPYQYPDPSVSGYMLGALCYTQQPAAPLQQLQPPHPRRQRALQQGDWNHHIYDPWWMESDHVNMTAFQNFRTSWKYTDCWVRVFQVGDEFRVKMTLGGNQVEKMAIVSNVCNGEDLDQPHFADQRLIKVASVRPALFRIPSSHVGQPDGWSVPRSSIKALFDDIAFADGRPCLFTGPRCYENVTVYRGGRSMGTLSYIKKAANFWRDHQT